MPTGILRTKLYRPEVSDDLVPRPRLLDRLTRYQRRPLTLIVAPAGYDKTTLVSSLINKLDRFESLVALVMCWAMTNTSAPAGKYPARKLILTTGRSITADSVN